MSQTQEIIEEAPNFNIVIENPMMKTQVYEIKSLNSLTQFNK